MDNLEQRGARGSEPLPKSKAGSWHGTNVAVTGATGFIGRHLVERLSRDGANVTCLLRGEPSGRHAAHPSTAAVALDLANTAAVSNALDGTDVVFHCAYDWMHPSWNVAAARALVEACLAQRVHRLVHLSTFSVYEVLAAGELTEQSAPASSDGGYAQVKQQLETEILRAVHDRGVAAAILQPTIVYGPFSRPWTIDPADMLVNGTVVLPDGGKGVCNALHVDDLVDALLLAARVPGAVGERFIVSGPETISWGEFYEEIARTVGAAGPAYRPSNEIAAANGRHGLVRAVADPGLLLRRAAQKPAASRVLEPALRVLPEGARTKLHDRLFGPVTRRRGHTHLPNAAQLHFFGAKSCASSAKARTVLGYAPHVDFRSGMAATAPYLRAKYRRSGPTS